MLDTAQIHNCFHLNEVVKHLEKSGANFTLRAPSLILRAGDFACFAGDSGCGKTTLLDMLGLVAAPTRALRFDVQAIRQVNPLSVVGLKEDQLAEIRRHYFGYVLQSGGLLPFLSVGENIMLSRRASGMGSDTLEAKRLASRLGIEDQWNKKPGFLSGGQRQRVAIARAIAHSPTVILADEPTGSVDKITAADIRDLLVELARERGITVVFVTHDLDLVQGLSNRIFSFAVRRISESEVESTLFETDWASIRLAQVQR